MWRRAFPFFAVVLLPCGPTDEDIERGAAQHSPGCTVVEWWIGEGDGDHAYVTEVLDCDGRRHEEQWLYQDRGRRWVAWFRVDRARPEGGLRSP